MNKINLDHWTNSIDVAEKFIDSVIAHSSATVMKTLDQIAETKQAELLIRNHVNGCIMFSQNLFAGMGYEIIIKSDEGSENEESKTN